MVDTPWLSVAQKYVGLHEIEGPQHNQKILEFFKNSGHPEIHDDETAWCAAFLGQCLYESGYKNSRSLLARSYTTWGKRCEPKPGAIVVFPRGSDPSQGHVGIVKSVSGDKIRIISGNDSNQVKESVRSIATAIAFRWPSEEPDVHPPTAAAAASILTLMGAFITGHKALIIVAGALILIWATLAYLENKKKQNA